jgi:hypothetical protein
MTSVGADGQLFVMTGPLVETRETSFASPDGQRVQLRFTVQRRANRFGRAWS